MRDKKAKKGHDNIPNKTTNGKSGNFISHNEPAKPDVSLAGKDYWEKIFDSISDWILLTDINGRILKTNKVGEKYTGISQKEILGQICCRLIHGTDEQIEDCMIQKMIRTGKRQSGRVQFQNKEQEFIVRIEPVFGSDGNIESFIHIIHDINQDKGLLGEHERILNLTDELVCIITLDGYFTYLNPAWEKFLGYTIDEFLSQPVFNFIYPEDHAKSKIEIKKLADGQPTIDLKIRVVHKDGTIRYTSWRARPVPEEKLVYSIGRDITETMKIEEALRESEKKYRSVVENANLAVVIIQNDKLVFHNSKIAEILGYSDNEFSEIDFLSNIHPDDRSFTIERIKNRFSNINMDPDLAQIRVLTKSGQIRWIETNSTIIQWEGKPALQSFITDITDRKQVEEALHESEEKFRNLAEQSPNMIFINKKGKVVYANKRSSEILGYERDEYYSDDFDYLCLIEPKSIEKIKYAFSKHLKGQEVEPYEYTLLSKSGERIEAIITTKLIDYEGAKSILGIITDITERKKAENALRKSEEKWRLLYENLPGGSFVVNKDYIIEDVNDILCIVTGFKREELVGRSCGIICPKGPHKCPIFDLGKTRIDNDETAVKTKDGSLVPILKSARKIPLADKEVIVENFQDITKRKKVEEELKYSEARYHGLFNNANDAIFVMDFDTFIECNDKTLEIFGCTNEQIVGKKPYGPFSPELQPDGRNSREKALENIRLALNGQSMFFEWCHLKYDGTPFEAEVSLNPLELAGKTYLQAMVRDISERKKAEKSLQRSEYNLIEAQRIAHIGSWALHLDSGEVICSDEMLRIWGYDPPKSHLTIEEILERIHPGDRDRVLKAIERTVSDDTGYEEIFHLVLPDQSKRIIHGLGHIEKDSQGKPCFIIGTGQDITERKQVEDILRQNEWLLNEVGKIAKIGGWEMDMVTRKAKWTQGTYDIVEIDYDQQVPGPDEHIEYYLPEYQPIVEQAMKKLIEDDIPLDFEAKLRTAKGNIKWCRAIGKSIREDGVCIKAFGTFQDISERKEIEENVLKYQKQLKSLASQLTLTEEKERHRIAMELHDNISQYLAVSRIKLEEIRHAMDSVQIKNTLGQVSEWLAQAMDQTHLLTFDLSSPILYELGFERAVAAWLEDEVQKKHNIETEYHSDGLPKVLDEDIRVLLFRNVRELLFNIIKHARAKKVKVFVTTQNNSIKIVVEDNGVGFNPDEVIAAAAGKAKFGLFSIRERLEHFGGSFEIDSAPGHGCRVTLIAPLKN